MVEYVVIPPSKLPIATCGITLVVDPAGAAAGTAARLDSVPTLFGADDLVQSAILNAAMANIAVATTAATAVFRSVLLERIDSSPMSEER